MSAVHASEGGFTGAEFLQWSAEEQRSFVNNALIMAMYVISQSDKQHSDCVRRWYDQDRRNGFPIVRATIADHAERNPQLIMLALVEQECGSLDFSKAR